MRASRKGELTTTAMTKNDNDKIFYHPSTFWPSELHDKKISFPFIWLRHKNYAIPSGTKYTTVIAIPVEWPPAVA